PTRQSGPTADPPPKAKSRLGRSATQPTSRKIEVNAARITSWLVVGMASWWLAFPVAFAMGLALVGRPSANVFETSTGVALLWVGIGGAGLAPIIGFATALLGRRRRASAYFAGMGALTLCCIAFLLYALHQA
ncbi:hypothetical protein, partial [Actinomadura sp. 7K507]|uniref:hypothetical protein n=1 Tax=Actinomadura sp. 7K507 TaxID=2530365 RepID=UPI001A9E7B72